MIDGIGKFVDGLAPVLERTGDSPVQFAGRVAGLGRAEMAAGVPKWAWAGIGLVAGVALMWTYGAEVKRLVKR